MEVGTALTEIREGKLYREQGWDTAEDYCQERWGWSRQRASQLIQASETMGDLSTHVDIHLPQNEGQVRPLASLPTPEAKQEVWTQVVEQHGENVTAAKVREAVDARLHPRRKTQPRERSCGVPRGQGRG